jgi:hypothetical protein
VWQHFGELVLHNLLGLTAISDQKNYSKFFESVAKQHFQKIYWFGFERKVL